MQLCGSPHSGQYLRLCPLCPLKLMPLKPLNRCAKTKKHGPNERTDQNSRKRSDEEIANLSDAEFKTLLIRMLTAMVEYGHKIEEKVKTTK